MNNPIEELFGNMLAARKAAERFIQLVVAILGEESNHISTCGAVQMFVSAVYVTIATEFGTKELRHFTHVFLKVSTFCNNGTKVDTKFIEYISNRFADETSWKDNPPEWWEAHIRISVLLLHETMVESFDRSHRRALDRLRLPQVQIIGEVEPRQHAEDASQTAVV